MGSMDTIVGQGDQLGKEAIEGANESSIISEDFSEVREGTDAAAGFDIDDDLKSAVEAAKEAARGEAQSDLQESRNSLDAKSGEMDQVKEDINAKITDNESAISSVEGISSSYGADKISSFIDSANQNSDMGREGIESMDSMLAKASAKLDDIENSIRD